MTYLSVDDLMIRYLFYEDHILKRTTYIPHLTAILASAISPAIAAQSTSELINKVIGAYGGNVLTSTQSIKLIDYNKGPWPGESENPGLPEVWRINEELTIDFDRKRKALVSYRVPRTTLDLEKWIFDGKQGIKYDIFHQKYANVDWLSFNNLGGSIVRSSDTMHAKHLQDNLGSADYLGDEYFRGKIHHKLQVKKLTGGQFTYYIDNASGLINKAIRHHPSSTLVYVFSNHQVEDGLTYASDMNFFVNGELRLMSVKRGLERQPDLQTAFYKPSKFEHWGETIDSSQLKTKQISKQLFQVGKGRSKTVFVEQADHFIAIGGANAISANFAELSPINKGDKPLRYFVVTHHHRDNLTGLNDVVELGAKLIVARAHQTSVQSSLSNANAQNAMVIIEDGQQLNVGNLTLFDIATAHSQHYLLAYMPGNRLIIAEEHYESNLLDGKPRIYKDMVRFADALVELNLDVNKLIDVRSWRQFSYDEFKSWTDNFEEKVCPAGYEVCSGG